MGARDAFIALLEYGAESVGTALFSWPGVPRPLDARWFRANQLERTIAGQVGLQRFFTEQGRAFSLYVVLGAAAHATGLVDRVNAFLSRLLILPVPGGAG
jgi:hypothetical protein